MSAERPAPERPAEGHAAAPSARRIRLGLLAVVGIGVTAAAGVTIVTGGPRLLAAVGGLPLGVLAAVFALDFASWGAEGLVFAALAGARGLRGWVRMVVVYVGGGFPGLVTPFGSGAIPGWVYALTREGLSPGEATAVLGARGLITSAFFVTAAGVAAAFAPAAFGGSSASIATGVVGLLAVFAVAVAVAVRPRVAARLLGRLLGSGLVRRIVGPERAERATSAVSREAERFATSLSALARHQSGALVLALLGVLLSRAFLLAILPVLLYGLGYRGAVLPLVLTIVAVWAVASGSPTPGGTGAVEVALAAVLSTFAPAAIAGAAALLWRGITFYFDLVVGWAMFARIATRTAGPPPQPRSAG